MLGYIIGYIKNIFNPGVGIATIVDNRSEINRLAKTNRFVKIINSKIGRYSYVGNNTWITNSNIGHFCSIADNVNIGLATHTLKTLSTSPIFTEVHNGTGHTWIAENKEKKYVPYSRATTIGNDVWIGSRVMIMKGVTIGDGAIIGAGAIVTKDIPPYAIAVGVPAKVVRYRFSEEIIKELINANWWDMSDDKLKLNIELFQNDVSMDFIMKLSSIKNKEA